MAKARDLWLLRSSLLALLCLSGSMKIDYFAMYSNSKYASSSLNIAINAKSCKLTSTHHYYLCYHHHTLHRVLSIHLHIKQYKSSYLLTDRRLLASNSLHKCIWNHTLYIIHQEPIHNSLKYYTQSKCTKFGRWHIRLNYMDSIDYLSHSENSYYYNRILDIDRMINMLGNYLLDNRCKSVYLGLWSNSMTRYNSHIVWLLGQLYKAMSCYIVHMLMKLRM